MQETISAQLAAATGVSSGAVLESPARGIPIHHLCHGCNAGDNTLRTILRTKQEKRCSEEAGLSQVSWWGHTDTLNLKGQGGGTT